MALLMQSCTTLNHPSNISQKLINIRDIYHFSRVLFGMHGSLPGIQNDISHGILIKFKDSNEIRETLLLLHETSLLTMLTTVELKCLEHRWLVYHG